MTLYILKFSACLALLIIFYKIILEKEDFHVFKRYYLLGSIIVSFVIPLITFTTYIAPISNDNQPITDILITTEKTFNYLPFILFGIYGIGLLIFGYIFIRNLYQIGNRIKRNKKIKTEEFTSVLLKEPVLPHTFFSYIFFNKIKFENRQIPEEVILHEKTHAVQKHSIDVLFIELLQVIFWFNPLIYIIKHAIKLNHEFLADEAVLKNGTSPSKYQRILLAFSSNAAHSPLANAINYSFIKKRFTVMKTNNSKKTNWVKYLLLLPLVSILLFSFSNKVEVEKETTLIETITEQDGASKKQVAEYNKLAKKYNSQNGERIVIKKKEVERLNYLYNLMSESQKKSVEPYPNFPPPPPPPSPKIIKGVNDKDSNIPPPPPPPPPAPDASKVIKGVNDTEANIPPPPPPPDAPKVISVKDYEKKLTELAKDGARFLLFDGGPHFKNGEEISLERALEIIKKINGLTINIKEDYLIKIVELRVPGC